MSRLDWVRRTVLESGASLVKSHKSRGTRGMRRRQGAAPRIVEALEDRTLLTNYVVNTTSDDADDAAGVADGLLSLREAIIAANTNAAFGDAPAGMADGDSIQFDPLVFSGPEAARTITMSNGPYTITDDLRIRGTAPDVILDANGNQGFLIVSNQLTVLTNLTIRNAAANAGSGGGGGIRISGSGRAVLSRLTIENSTSATRGGAILNVSSTLEASDLKIRGNQAVAGGGIANVNGIVTIDASLIENNTASDDGGGIHNDGGRLILRDSVVANNTTNGAAGLRGGGGIHNRGNGRLVLSGSSVIGNQATNSRGGGIFSSTGDLTIEDSTISGNFAALSGGGIEIVNGSLGMTGSLLGGTGLNAGNSAGNSVLAPANGGGLHNGGTAVVRIDDSRVQFNVATGEGGGLWNGPQGLLVVRGGAPPAVTSISEAVGFGTESIQTSVDEFRAALGTNNGGVPGSQGSGRREINWDGAPNSVATPNFFPPDFFNSPNAPTSRGVVVSTPGTGFQLSATAAANVGILYSNLNTTYTQTFAAFSEERLFTPIGSNVTVVDFFVPGTDTPAVVQGFGAVFTDVDVANGSKIEFFDVNGNLLLTRSVLNVAGQKSLSFLGATFSFPVVAQVRITAGTGSLGLRDISLNGPTDVVVLDDFIYGEPIDPATIATNTHISGNVAHGDDADQGGGGIYNDRGRVVMFDVTMSNNIADGVAGSGGGILSTGGTLTLDQMTLTGNRSARAGGGIEIINGQANLTNVNLDGNDTGLLPFGQPNPGNGGGLHVTGSARVRLTGGVVQNNIAAKEGGGLWNSPGGVMTVDGTQIIDNVAHGALADDGGGGIFNQAGRLDLNNVLVSGNSADGAAGSGGGLFDNEGTVTIADSTFDLNFANRAGGGIETRAGRVSLTDVTLSNNGAGNGGGLHSTGPARVDIYGGLIEDNTASSEGGGLWNSELGRMILHFGTTIRNNTALGDDTFNGGGGIFNDGGRLAIASALIADNSAGGLESTGGGLLIFDGYVTIENSTISGNTASNAGGGIANFGTLFSTNNTIVQNVSNPDGTLFDGGGVFTESGGNSTLRNTIVAGNLTQTGTRGRPIASDLGGVGYIGSAFNLIADPLSAASLVNGVNSNIVGLDGAAIPLSTILDVNLDDNGGPTLTHALTFSSPAINRGSNALAINLSTGLPLEFDQRGPGFPRIFNSTVDIGAFER